VKRNEDGSVTLTAVEAAEYDDQRRLYLSLVQSLGLAEREFDEESGITILRTPGVLAVFEEVARLKALDK
jgi:hypothetical protein